MAEDFIRLYQRPPFRNPILIAGFEGWANAGNIALKSIEYIIQKKGATLMAEIDQDRFYQFTQNRPVVTIKEGRLQDICLKKIRFYFWSNKEGNNDLILLKAQEPDYRWSAFVQVLFQLCKQWGVSLIISVGGVHDDVLHTEAVVSGVYSFKEWRDIFIKKDIHLTEYEGPSGVHSLIMQKAEKESCPVVGLWGHSPLYLTGTNFRVVIRIINLIASLFAFSIETLELEGCLKEFEREIGEILETNTELREYTEKIKKIRSGELRKKDTPKVINIKDFIRHKDS
ncbi:MAG: PAC2 family protein [Desulfatiglandales bacterium]|jgi:proteasome assembly chaperone (PAC2) family protein